MLTYTLVMDAIKKQKNADITFRELHSYVNASFSGLLFYYEGFTGRLLFYYGDQTTVYLIEGDSWNKKNIILELSTSTITDIPTIFNDMIAHVVQKNALPNALHPPLYLFEEYLKALPYHFPLKAVHECLMREMSAKDIEIASLTDKNPVKTYDYENTNIYFAQLFGRYLVINTEAGYAETFNDKTEALGAFQKQINEYEERRYKNYLNNAQLFLDDVTKSIT